MEFDSCKQVKNTAKLREGLWVCGFPEKCENKLYSKYAVAFCRVPLIENRMKEIEKLRKEVKEDVDGT